MYMRRWLDVSECLCSLVFYLVAGFAMPDFENKPDFNDALNTLGANQGNASDQTISVNDPDSPSLC